ncbi:MAG TPA: hypothetical protein VGF28_06325 [Thermoanaerobaculia bacterium]
MDLTEITADNMQPHVGTRFTVRFEDGASVELTLDHITVYVEKHIDARLSRDSFGLYFLSPKDHYFPQGTYMVSHESFGELPIFLSPKGRHADGGFEFEAIFT